MKQVNLYEAKTRLSALVDQAAGGEEIIIAKNGKARAKLVPCTPDVATPRRFGAWGEMYGYQAPADFPTTSGEDIAAWEAGSIFPDDAD